jgi:hypothetical protein
MSALENSVRSLSEGVKDLGSFMGFLVPRKSEYLVWGKAVNSLSALAISKGTHAYNLAAYKTAAAASFKSDHEFQLLAARFPSLAARVQTDTPPYAYYCCADRSDASWTSAAQTTSRELVDNSQPSGRNLAVSVGVGMIALFAVQRYFRRKVYYFSMFEQIRNRLPELDWPAATQAVESVRSYLPSLTWENPPTAPNLEGVSQAAVELAHDLTAYVRTTSEEFIERAPGLLNPGNIDVNAQTSRNWRARQYMSCVFGGMLEELVRHTIPNPYRSYISIGYGLLEAALGRDDWGLTATRVMAHLSLANLPVEMATPLHGLFNLVQWVLDSGSNSLFLGNKLDTTTAIAGAVLAACVGVGAWAYLRAAPQSAPLQREVKQWLSHWTALKERECLEEGVFPCPRTLPRSGDVPVNLDDLNRYATRKGCGILVGSGQLEGLLAPEEDPKGPTPPTSLDGMCGPAHQVQYPLIATTCLPHAPMGARHKVLAVLIRKCADSSVDRIRDYNAARLTARWHDARVTVSPLYKKLGDKVVVTQAEWAEKFPSEAKRIRARCSNEQKASGYLRCSVSNELKSDEKLFPKSIDLRKLTYGGTPLPDFIWCLKSRNISNVDHSNQSETGPEALSCTYRLKEAWNGRNVYEVSRTRQSAKCVVVPFFACGVVASELDQWRESLDHIHSLATEDTWALGLAVLGDDCTFALAGGEWKIFVDNDFTDYDRTQGPEAQDAGSEGLEELGMPKKQRDALRDLGQTSSTITFRHHGKFKVLAPEQMLSGTSTTCLTNSTGNVTAHVYGLTGLRQPEYYNSEEEVIQDLRESIESLGFACKINNAGPNHITFLRHWWVPSADLTTRYAVPLPSSLLKLGCILTDPQSIFKKNGTEMMAAALAANMRQLPEGLPLLGAFRSALLRVAENAGADPHAEAVEPSTGLVQRAINPDWMYKIQREKPVCSGVSTPQLLSMIQDRYSLSPSEVSELVMLLGRVKQAPCVVLSPYWRRLVEADY